MFKKPLSSYFQFPYVSESISRLFRHAMIQKTVLTTSLYSISSLLLLFWDVYFSGVTVQAPRKGAGHLSPAAGSCLVSSPFSI